MGRSVHGLDEAGPDGASHARRKFDELWVNHKSPAAEEALTFLAALYDMERIARELDADER